MNDVDGPTATGAAETLAVRIAANHHWLDGELRLPTRRVGLVIFAHGSGSSRFSRRNQHVAGSLEHRGLATLLIDLLTREEETIDARTAEYRFDLDLLASRLVAIVDWARGREETAHLPIGLFGASTGGGAALMAAAARPHEVAAVVSRGGRPDLARDALGRVTAPTLLIVGENDRPVLAMNRSAMTRLAGEAQLAVVPGATHLFEEPGALDTVAELAAKWFLQRFAQSVGPPRSVTHG
jgi:pimeloyl-ACP methyl ester carboxylesterase